MRSQLKILTWKAIITQETSYKFKENIINVQHLQNDKCCQKYIYIYIYIYIYTFDNIYHFEDVAR